MNVERWQSPNQCTCITESGDTLTALVCKALLLDADI
jgi:hypothetical protein